MKYINVLSLIVLCVTFAPDIIFDKNTKYQINADSCAPKSSLYINVQQNSITEKSKNSPPPPPKIKPKYIDID